MWESRGVEGTWVENCLWSSLSAKGRSERIWKEVAGGCVWPDETVGEDSAKGDTR